MFGLGMPELIVIMIIVLVVFGAKRLPEVGSGLGKGIKSFKEAFGDAEKEISSIKDKVEDDKNKPA